MDGWRKIEFSDVPSRSDFEELTLQLMRRGITNSDRMRDKIRQDRKLIIQKANGRWNETPSDKFVNQHAWALEELLTRRLIEKLSEKEYRLLDSLSDP
jgi:hypothetical protein